MTFGGSHLEVKPLIREHLLIELLRRQDIPLDDETPLIEEGYVTSLQAVELVMFLEERFQVQIDPEEVNEEDFHSLNTIADLVERKLG